MRSMGSHSVNTNALYFTFFILSFVMVARRWSVVTETCSDTECIERIYSAVAYNKTDFPITMNMKIYWQETVW
jgi:hypothetical protein